MYNTKSELKYKLWTLVIITMRQCKILSCNKCTTQVGDIDNGGAMHVWGDGVYEKSL